MTKFPCAYCPVCGLHLRPARSQVSVEGILERSWFACRRCGYQFDLSGGTCERAQKVQRDIKHYRKVAMADREGGGLEVGKPVQRVDAVGGWLDPKTGEVKR